MTHKRSREEQKKSQKLCETSKKQQKKRLG